MKLLLAPIETINTNCPHGVSSYSNVGATRYNMGAYFFMKTKVQIISNRDFETLQNLINEFIFDYNENQIIDIKYNTVSAPNNINYPIIFSALIIYKIYI